MALINCPKCGKQISDRSLQCPQCGLTKEERERIISNEFNNSAPVSNYLSSEQQQKLLEELKYEVEKRNATLKAIDDAIAKQNERFKKNEAFFNEQKAKLTEKRKQLDNQIAEMTSQINDQMSKISKLNEELAHKMKTVGQSDSGNYRSKGEKILVIILCIAIVAVIAWIISMVIRFN